MKYYKELLLEKLSLSGWELVEINDNTDWWLEEYWQVKSNQQNWGTQIFVLFLVDPMFEGTKKSQAIWAVMATENIPKQRPLGTEGIVLMDLVKGKFDSKLEEFTTIINQYRDNIGL